MKLARFGDSYCKPCPDNETFSCGRAVAFQGTLFSLYDSADKELEDDYYHYLQCIKRPPFNSLAKVYKGASELHHTNYTPDVQTCLNNCQKLGYEMVILSLDERNYVDVDKHEGKQYQFQCDCVNSYKIRMQEIADDCLLWWCPSLKGKVK